MSKKIEIEFVDWGVANRFFDPDVIEVNRHLQKEPELLKQILKHELEHTDSSFSLYDLKHDMTTAGKVDNIKLFKFMAKHPKSFSQLLPIYYNRKRKQIIYDINLSIYYLILFGLIGIGIWAGLGF